MSGEVIYTWFVRVLGFFAAIYFGLFAVATWWFIATEDYTWRNVIAAITLSVMFFTGVFVAVTARNEGAKNVDQTN